MPVAPAVICVLENGTPLHVHAGSDSVGVYARVTVIVEVAGHDALRVAPAVLPDTVVPPVIPDVPIDHMTGRNGREGKRGVGNVCSNLQFQQQSYEGGRGQPEGITTNVGLAAERVAVRVVIYGIASVDERRNGSPKISNPSTSRS